MDAYVSVQCAEGRCHACRPLDWACTHQCHVTAEVALADSAVVDEAAPPIVDARTDAAESANGAADANDAPDNVTDLFGEERAHTPADALPRTGSTP